MIEATREKYNGLAEVQQARLAARQEIRYRSNRLMGDIFSSRLQRKVVRGRVSHTVHTRVV